MKMMKVLKLVTPLATLLVLLSFSGCQSPVDAGLATGDLEKAAKIGSSMVIGYMPTWQGNVNTIQYNKLTHINYAFAVTDSSGNLTCENTSALKTLVTKAHAAAVKVLISVGGASNGDVMTTAIKNSTARNKLIQNIENFVSTYKLDGADLDWEGPFTTAEGNLWKTVMQKLYTDLHPKGKLVTAAVDSGDWFGMNIPSSAFASVDFVNIMAYDNDGSNHSTYSFAQSCLNYWLGRGLPKSKANLGVPFYGYKGTDRNNEVAYKDIVAKDSSAPNKDSSNGVGYNGIPTITKKAQLAKNSAAGIMIWELSEDTTGSTSLLNAIYNTLK